MKYLARDGKVFDNAHACKQYENRLNVALSDKKKDWEKLKELNKKYESVREEYADELEKFCDKYYPFMKILW